MIINNDNKFNLSRSDTGNTIKMLSNIDNIKLPWVLPSKGHVCFKKPERNSKENLFAYRKRTFNGTKHNQSKKIATENLAMACQLTPIEKQKIIKSSWLNDEHMNAVKRILKHLFPNKGALNDILLGPKLQFPILRRGFCYIIHESGNRWITLPSIFCS